MSNALKILNLDWQSLSVDPGVRADDVTIENFLMIAAQVESQQDKNSSQE